MKPYITPTILFFLSLFIFTQNLNIHGLEYRDDEIFYVKSTQEMVVDRNYLSPTYFGQDRFQKPILYYWFILLSYKIFGVSWEAARLVAGVFGALTVVLTWLIGKTLFNRRVALLSSLVLMTLPMFFRHAKNAVPDMPLNFFIVLAMYAAIRYFGDQDGQKRGQAILFFVACSLGFMIKGFAALIVPILTVVIFALQSKETRHLKGMRFLTGAAIFLVIALPWFMYMIKTHGFSYLSYMVVDETKNRLLGSEGGNPLLIRLATFKNNVLFYIRIIFSTFAPWSPFIFAAIPLAILKKEKDQKESRSLHWLLIWFFMVFIFFCFMSFAINHYLLVLTTPFAILVGYFFLEPLPVQKVGRFIVWFLRKPFMFFTCTVGYFVLMFVLIFMIGISKWWLLAFLGVYAATARIFLNTQSLLMAPLILCILTGAVFANSTLLDEAGLTAHATWQHVAQTIKEKDPKAEYMIAVASHDIHEKEFQAYFKRKVHKVANDDEQYTRQQLALLFDQPKKIYCLILKKDFDHYLKDVYANTPTPAHHDSWLAGSECRPPKECQSDQRVPDFNKGSVTLKIVRTDKIMRKRMAIDQGFFGGLLRLDQSAVRGYLMEDVYLVTHR